MPCPVQPDSVLFTAHGAYTDGRFAIITAKITVNLPDAVFPTLFALEIRLALTRKATFGRWTPSNRWLTAILAEDDLVHRLSFFGLCSMILFLYQTIDFLSIGKMRNFKVFFFLNNYTILQLIFFTASIIILCKGTYYAIVHT
jgi:hypothetical protein